MTYLPLLILPRPSEATKRSKKKRGGGNAFNGPDRQRQAERLGPRFAQLQEALNARRARLQPDLQGIIPEEVVVFETVGTVNGFLRGVRKISGMEWLAEVEETDIPPDDDFFAIDEVGIRREEKNLRGRLFMIFTNQDALGEMLSLWRRWQDGEELPHGLKSWRRLFEQLKDVRPWGVEDRLIETGVLEDWRERVAHGEQVVPCEIELWCRSTESQRSAARDRVVSIIESEGGSLIDEVVIGEISYHALLARLPIQSVGLLIQNADAETELVQCEQIQFFRAAGQMAGILPHSERGVDDIAIWDDNPRGAPVLAVLDGMPLQNHRRLADRLIIDDPDGFASECPPLERRHGTAMASLVIWDELDAKAGALRRPIYVRPILRPDARYWRTPRPETVPEDELLLDLIHRAVRRLFEGGPDRTGIAPSIRIINLSIGIRDRLFDNALSPLARLLDWLSWHYKVLFVVSAGNHPHRIEINVPRGCLENLSAHELEGHVIKAVASDARNRRLLSPAEGVNVLTVGSVHEDKSGGAPPPRWVDPFKNGGLPSPINAQGMGYRRSIKPDVLAPGGRIVVQEDIRSSGTVSLDVYTMTGKPGQSVAAPGSAPGILDATWATRGTSNATALVSRYGAILCDLLDELRLEPGGDLIDEIPRACWIKALLTHSAEWGHAERVLDKLLKTDQNSRQFREYLTRLLGYGCVNVESVLACTEFRATTLSGGYLQEDQRRIHRFPLPPSLSGQRGFRRVILTLAWLTPVNALHQGWRRAHLWLSPPSDTLRVDRRQADWQAVQRGTLQHEILEGEEAAVYFDDAHLEVEINCRADAGRFSDEIPYVLVSTLEVSEEIHTPIYYEIRDRIQAQVRIEPGS